MQIQPRQKRLTQGDQRGSHRNLRVEHLPRPMKIHGDAVALDRYDLVIGNQTAVADIDEWPQFAQRLAQRTTRIVGPVIP